MKEPATVILFLIGCIFAYFVSGTDVFELSSIHSATSESVLGRNNVFLGTVLLSGMGLLVTVFNAASEIPRDISSRMIAILLSKPVSRLEYVAGKFLGCLGIGVANTASWVTIMLICRKFLSDPEKAQALTTGVVLSQYTCLMILVPVTAIAICFSCWFSDVLSMIVTTIYVLLSFATAIVPIIVALSDSVVGKLMLAVYFLFPNMAFFLQSYDGFWGNTAIVIYTFCTSCLFLLAGTSRFGTGDVF